MAFVNVKSYQQGGIDTLNEFHTRLNLSLSDEYANGQIAYQSLPET